MTQFVVPKVFPFSLTFRSMAFVAVAFVWQCANAEAAFELRLSVKNITAEDVGAVLRYLKDVQNKLPEQMVSTIDRPIKVNFRALGGSQMDRLPVPVCSGEKMRNVVYGFAIGSTVYLNRRLLTDIISGPMRARTYPCKHGNMYRKAVGVLIHEIGHLYDKSDSRTPEGRGAGASSKQGKIVSADPSFMRLANWKRSFLGFGPLVPKNKIHERSPDQYEFHNIAEYFAVNLEYFLLDRDFKCRLPVLYHYYTRHFNHDPFSSHRCIVNTKVFLSTSKTRAVDLNPDRIYRVNYLLADDGRELASRFGHSLVHLVVCAPERAAVGPDCEKDTNHHVVLSFAARVDDLQLNFLKGVFGGYNSQPFLLPLNKVQRKYNYKQLRALSSHSLTLTTEEKQLIVYRILELYWTYLGSFRFVTNNCAVETRGLFQSILWEAPILYSHAVTPRKVLQSLESNRGTNEVISYPAYRNSLIRNYFRVYPEKFAFGLSHGPKREKKVVKKILKELTQLDAGRFLERFNEATSGQFMQIRVLYQNPRQLPLHVLTRAVQDIQSLSTTVSAYRFLTLYAHMKLQAKVDGTKANLIRKFTKRRSNRLGNKFHEYRKTFKKALPYYLPKGGYGIPLINEMPSNAQMAALEQTKVKLNRELYDLIDSHRKMNKKRIRRKVQRLENLEQVTNEISNRLNELRALKSEILPVFVRAYLREMLRDPKKIDPAQTLIDSLKRYHSHENHVALRAVSDQIYSRLNEYLGINALNNTYVNPWGLIKIAAELNEASDR